MDTSNPLGLAKAFLPKVPMLGKTAIFHTLGLSQHSKQWDLRTELIISVLRSFLNAPSNQTISQIQRLSIKDPGIKGRIWISKVVIPTPPEDDIRAAVFGAVEDMKLDSEPLQYTQPDLAPVEAEWTGYRAGATLSSVPLKIPESQQYTELMKEVTSPATVLYFHGGAYYLMDPATHRPTTKKLAKLTGGRCLSVRYRLAPKHAFPAALIDALSAYLFLLYPPPSSFHAPVLPQHIVLAGDSAGGNLALALTQLLLHLSATSRVIVWQGQERSIPLPGGIATNSAWADITHSSPSVLANQTYDYLPGGNMMKVPTVPECPIWPASPPRAALFCADALLTHPLVSPLSAASWAGAPPMYFVVGEELLTDENKYIASKAVKEGVKVKWEQYEAMPHCFALVVEGLEGGKRCFRGWSGFIREVVEKGGEGIVTGGVWVGAKTLVEGRVDVEDLVGEGWSREEVLGRMRGRVKDLVEGGKAKL